MKVTFSLLVRILLPFHKRQSNRLSFLNVFAQKADSELSALSQFKEKSIKSLNVTGQTMILEHHLSVLFNTVILIIHTLEEFLSIGLIEQDGEFSFVAAGLDELEGSYLTVAMQGENTTALDFDYQVLIPSGVSKAAVESELNKYRIAGKKYEIVILE
ncbi:MAG: hypothetical protein GX587_08190 [Bacteroidales bacterium]|nr:hypothetical protein [Bacteroidales bacterium]